MRRFFSIFIAGCLSLFTTSCNQIGLTQTNSHPVPKKPFQAVEPTEQNIDKLIAEGPVIYAGNKYDKKKVEQEMLKVKNAPVRVQYNKIIELLAEDYRPAKKYFENVDLSIGPMLPLPDAQGGKGRTGASPQANKQKVNVEILLDASGSMAEKIESRTKMDLAKEAINKFVSSLPKEVQVAFRVFGNRGSNKQQDKAISCQSSNIVYPLQSYDSISFNQAIEPIQPTGWTPLALAIRQAQADLQNETGAKNIVYVVSDGMETCGGDPMAAARALHSSKIQAVINIIGFDVNNEEQRALKAVAEAGNGKFTTVKDEQDLNTYFENEKQVSILDYLHWEIANYDKSKEIADQKRKEVADFWDAYVKKLSTEEDRILDACYVVHKDVLACTGWDELGRLILKRHELIWNWLWNLKEQAIFQRQEQFNENVNQVFRQKIGGK